jgi:predicted DNA-binding protein (MmcQ/YjbR family)
MELEKLRAHLLAMIDDSYRLVVRRLTKKRRQDLQ